MENNELTELKNITSRKEKFQFAHENENLHDEKFETKQVSYIVDCLRRFAKNRSSVVGFIIIIIIALFGIIQPMASPTHHVDRDQFPSGFNDPKLEFLLPKLKMFEGTGFWDGTKKESYEEAKYYGYYFNDSNYTKVTLIDTYVRKTVLFGDTVMYNVRHNSYALGVYKQTLTPEKYHALVEYDKKHSPEDKKILKPLVDYTTYLKKLRDELRNTYTKEDVSDATIDTLIKDLVREYTTNADVYYELVPEVVRGKPSQRYIPKTYKDDEGNVTVHDIYKRDANGDLVYSELINDMYEVRVDYYDYFTYEYGFEPVFAFGTDKQGKDIILRLALGVRFSLALGISITFINFIIGLIWGAISGYYGGRVDLLMERFTDIIANVPTIIIMTIAQIQLTSNHALKDALGPGGTIILAILIAFVYNGWVGVAGTTRMQFYRFKGQEYVLASRTLGAKDKRLIFKHILPNAAGTLVTRSVLMVPGIIFSEASLSYLGIINFEASDLSSIGAMITDGQKCFSNNPHVLLFPAIVISLLMISFNLFGNGLRDAFNTTLRGSED